MPGLPAALRRELSDVVRGACGGLLFGVPLFFTVEIWWYGSWADPRWVVGALALSFLAVTALNRTSGFRDSRAPTLADAAIDGVEMVALGLAGAALMLALLQRITPDTSLEEAIGATTFEAIPFAIGAALARQFLRRPEEPRGEAGGDGPAIGRTLADAGAAAIGALVLSASIAPTDEVPMLVAAIGPVGLAAVVVASLAISYAIVFQADFRDQEARRDHEGLFQRPVTETLAAYLVSLAVAAATLLFFQRIGPDQSWETWLASTIVLGLPAAVGGAAGRLAV